MTSAGAVGLGDLAPDTEPAAAAAWLRAWFGDDYPDEFVTLAMLRNMGGTGGRAIPRYLHVPIAEAIQTVEAHGLDDLVYAQDKNWNVFVSVAAIKAPPVGRDGKPSMFRKGGRRDVSRVPGVWVDLDVDKSESFGDEDECLSFLRALPAEVRPSIVVATGTGGVHAYWKTNRPLGMLEAEALCTRWWVYLTSRTDRQIDKLTNADRIMKLPGTVRWPKITGDAPTPVRLLAASGSWRIDVATLEKVTEPAYTAYLRDIEERKRDIAETRARAAWGLVNNEQKNTNRWGKLMTLAVIEDQFNEMYSWDDILPGLGWTKMEQDSEGRDQWARPGLDEWELHKSAATDYEGSHVMSLFSDSPETGLARLKDTGVALTKYRVYVECVWHGDEEAFVNEWVKQGAQAPVV